MTEYSPQYTSSTDPVFGFTVLFGQASQLELDSMDLNVFVPQG